MAESAAELLALLADANLRALTSAGVFDRGRTYARSGAVQALEPLDGTATGVRTVVAGTQPYAVELRLGTGEIDGACTCPNAADGWFCKHQVAVAVVWRETLAGREPTLDSAAAAKVEASRKRQRTMEERRQSLHDFLHRQDAAALAARLLDLADRDSGVQRELQQWRKLVEVADRPDDVARLVREFLSPGRDLMRHDEVAAFAHRAADVLPLLEAARLRDAVAGIDLAMLALRRTWLALEHVDDSDGLLGDLCREFGGKFVTALQAAGARPADFGDSYLSLRLDDPFRCFDSAAAEAAIGPVAVARYRSRLASGWRAAQEAELALRQTPPAGDSSRERASRDRRDVPELDYAARARRYYALTNLRHLHLEQLEAAGDVDGVLEVLGTDLSTPFAFHELTLALERAGRLREAFDNADRAAREFPDDRRIEEDALRAYERDGWVREAIALRRRRFDREPSVHHYEELLSAAVAAADDRDALRAELLAALAAREVTTSPPTRRVSGWGAHGGKAAERGRDVSLRAAILCSEQRFDEALALVQPPATCAVAILESLAQALGPGRQRERVALLKRVFAFHMDGASSPYREPLRLVAAIVSLLDPLERDAWLRELRTAYAAKRNFMRDLPA